MKTGEMRWSIRVLRGNDHVLGGVGTVVLDITECKERRHGILFRMNIVQVEEIPTVFLIRVAMKL